MKDFIRADQLFFLCGLNCGLCTMCLGGYCPGCGGGKGNQNCAIARCGLDHGGIAYCWQCGEFPCARYKEDEYGSFITHQNRLRDLENARRTSMEAYHAEQREKCGILHFLLENTVKPRKCLRRKASSDRSDEFTTNLLLWEKLAALRNSQLNKFNIPPAGL